MSQRITFSSRIPVRNEIMTSTVRKLQVPIRLIEEALNAQASPFNKNIYFVIYFFLGFRACCACVVSRFGLPVEAEDP